MMSVLEYFDLLEKKMSIRFLSSERTIIYSKVVCHLGETLIQRQVSNVQISVFVSKKKLQRYVEEVLKLHNKITPTRQRWGNVFLRTVKRVCHYRRTQSQVDGVLEAMGTFLNTE